MAQAKQRLI